MYIFKTFVNTSNEMLYVFTASSGAELRGYRAADGERDHQPHHGVHQHERYQLPLTHGHHHPVRAGTRGAN